MSKISLTFSELNPEQAELLIKSHSEICGDNPEMVTTIQPATGMVNTADVGLDAATFAVSDAPIPLDNGSDDVDAFGVPWHAEMHAKTKSQKADGSWTRRRGVDVATVEAYEAQYRTPATSVPVVATPPAPDGMLPLPTPAAPQATAYPPADYASQLLPKWQEMTQLGKLPMDRIDECMRRHNAIGAGGAIDYTKISTDAAICAEIFAVLNNVA